MAANDQIAEGVAALAQFFIGEGTLGDTLTKVSDLACDALSADMAGITMLADGVPATAVFTDTTAPEIDAEQYRSGVGPCIDAWCRQVVNRIDDTTADQRWSRFCASAADHGVRSTLSLPLVAKGEGIGALNLYSKQVANFAKHDTGQAQTWASAAATLLANVSAYQDSRELTENLRQALTSRSKIDQAVGIVMSAGGRDADEAFQVLVRASQRENRKLREIAADIVSAAVERQSTRLPEHP
ncbi:MAG: hypothetical protein JWM85_15 [Acidimicrobiaceae bacterium]|nr:hypothetical protein [Acidimicrobiaceae bacterium]